MQQTLKERGELIEKAYSERFSEVSEKLVVQNFNLVCADRIQAVGQCYRESRGQTLNCSKVVSALQDCVEQEKEKRLN